MKGLQSHTEGMSTSSPAHNAQVGQPVQNAGQQALPGQAKKHTHTHTRGTHHLMHSNPMTVHGTAVAAQVVQFQMETAAQAAAWIPTDLPYSTQLDLKPSRRAAQTVQALAHALKTLHAAGVCLPCFRRLRAAPAAQKRWMRAQQCPADMTGGLHGLQGLDCEHQLLPRGLQEEKAGSR
jgi:hypothetical protein